MMVRTLFKWVLVLLFAIISCTKRTSSDNIIDLTDYRMIKESINLSEIPDYLPGVILSMEKVQEDQYIFLDFSQRSIFHLDTAKNQLHQIGSHGPSYFMRYPPEFEKFTPACQTPELKKCTADEVTNAYDNTIAFTDQVLAETIDVLSSLDGLTTAMFYVSDHGESLGEGGLYLHGAPYFMASKEQTHVPMLLWMSDRFATQFGHDRECLNNSRAAALSHDNLFHSLLGMMDITTDVYDRKLDLFAPCTANNRKS